MSPLAICLCMVLFLPILQSARADDVQSKIEQHKREFEQRRREFEQHRLDIQAKQAEMHKQMQQQPGSSIVTQSYGAGSNHRDPTRPYLAKPGMSDRMMGSSFEPLPFDAKKAPSPDLCFLKFVETVNKATTLDSVLPYLPYAEQRSLKEQQQSWSPQGAAQSKAQHLKLNPSTKADALDYLTEAPYVRELNSLKSMAAKVMRVRDMKLTGANKAVLEIATNNSCRNKSQGESEDFPYSRAKVEMLGQGNFWMFDTYNDSNAYYKAPQ